MQIITSTEVLAASDILEKYRLSKASLDSRIIENEKLYKMTCAGDGKTRRTAWMFNSIINKHADFMDAIPECTVLPREESDSRTAEALTKIIPAVLEKCAWENVYSDAAMYKLKAGTAAYAVVWNPLADHGRGDIDVRHIDLLNLFWEPGIKKLEDSRNVFYTELCDNDLLLQEYPFLEGKLGSGRHYAYSYAPDTSAENKSEVVDWYYKKRVNGNTILHYCKFVDGNVLYASENDGEYCEKGWYDHGRYPFVLDALFREEGSPAGFGYIDVMKSAQSQIDILDTEIVNNAKMSAKKRYFTRVEGAVNEKEFADFGKDFVHVRGSSLGEESIREISVNPLSAVYVNILQNKIAELKETSGNRDFSQGGTTGGVTSGTAINALQEAGNKLSRDMISASYRAFSEICLLCIELIRQFYDTPRCLRILAPDGKNEYVYFDNSAILPQNIPETFGVDFGAFVPQFDVCVKAHKKNPYTRAQTNADALEFFRMGFFNPEKRAEALACLEIMDVENKEKLKQALCGK